MPRTQDAIVARTQAALEQDFLGGATAYPLIEALDTEHVAQFINMDMLEEEWSDELDEDALVSMFDHACLKAHDHRGISANIGHYRAIHMAWLKGDDALVEQAESAGYPNYGAPVLRVVANGLGGRYLEAFTKHDEDGTLSRMADGLPCTDDCQEGCSR